MRLDVRIEGAAKGTDTFKQIRKEIGKSVKEDMADAVAEVALPVAKRLARGRRLRELTHAGATTRNAYLGVERRTARARRMFAGREGGEAPAVLMFGGWRRDPLRPKRRGPTAPWPRSKRNPKHAAALRVAPGVYRAAVTNPRKLRPYNHLEKAGDLTRTRVLARIQQKLEARVQNVPGIK